MNIRTIVHDDPSAFDLQVNQSLEAGYILGERRVIMFKDRAYHYAQLVLPDQPDEPETDDPIEALRTVQRVCLAVSGDDCGTDRCPLRKFCDRLRDGGDPTDWDLSEEAFT